MGDPFGGGISLVGDGISVGLLVTGIIIVATAEPDAGIVGYGSSEFDARIDLNKKREASLEKNKEPGYTCIIIGGVGLALSWTWGFVRPFLYDKSQAVQTVANVIDHVNIGLMPDNDGRTAVRVSLNYSF